ncbi:helix-turn-helix transcriptional regulator [Williamwhitmania taraxaci]|uniref:Regulatory protein, luxR family n=1 Tax=Williamwhitmania taraxaci TaxID=1640674 RepID=A0A1G6NKL6_9BACT|nr:LuxR C-terminal-related transcriptional regulator [Williamwhitmania taraxaci]SDC68433.1 regulatory protein, luxR family [Williamwhitmania taraxaci]
MIKLAIIHFPKGLRLDDKKNQGIRMSAFVAPPFVAPPDRLPSNYTISYIDLALSQEQEQALLHLIRGHQELENGHHLTTQISLEPLASLAESRDRALISSQEKALRGLTLMSEFIHSLRSCAGNKQKMLSLSSREIEIMVQLSLGLSNKAIANKLFISTNTVKNHTKNIYAKLGVRNRIEALRIFHSVHPDR